jgi:hypothetical protein
MSELKLPTAPINPTAPIEVPPGWPRPILSSLVEGSKGSGKSHTTAQFIRRYMDSGIFTRVFLISPTYFTNRHLWEFAGAKPGDVYLNALEGEEALKDIVRKIKLSKDQWVAASEGWKTWQLYQSGGQLTGQQLHFIDSLTEAPQPPKPLIRPVLVLDDLSHSPLLSGNKYFINLMLRARHICFGPQVGLNVFVLCQSIKSGLPRVLRQSVNYWVIFPTQDRSKVFQDIYPEVSGAIDKEAFLALFHTATSAPRQHLVIDLTQGKPIFRQNVDGHILYEGA